MTDPVDWYYAAKHRIQHWTGTQKIYTQRIYSAMPNVELLAFVERCRICKEPKSAVIDPAFFKALVDAEEHENAEVNLDLSLRELKKAKRVFIFPGLSVLSGACHQLFSGGVSLATKPQNIN